MGEAGVAMLRFFLILFQAGWQNCEPVDTRIAPLWGLSLSKPTKPTL